LAKAATIRARAEPDLKAEAEAVLTKLGLTPTQAITPFYREIVREKGRSPTVQRPALHP
jgi:DNA-damage-inducible protein J